MKEEQHPQSDIASPETGRGYEGNEGSVVCAACSCECEWEQCHAGCEDGYFDGYEEDPLWYDEGDLVPCNECGGHGGSWWCINQECKTGEVWNTVKRSPQIPHANDAVEATGVSNQK